MLHYITEEKRARGLTINTENGCPLDIILKKEKAS